MFRWDGATPPNTKPPRYPFGPARGFPRPSRSQIDVKLVPGLSLNPKTKPFSSSSGVFVPSEVTSASHLLFFTAEKVLARRKSSGPAHIPATLRPPEVLFTAHNMAL